MLKRAVTSWVTILIIVPVGVTFFTSSWTDKWFSRQEISASGYSIVAKEYPGLSHEGKEFINQRLAKGTLINADLTPIIFMMIDEKKEGIQTSPAPDFGDAPESFHAQTLRNILGRPTQSNAKDLLLKLAGSPPD